MPNTDKYWKENVSILAEGHGKGKHGNKVCYDKKN